MAVHASATTMAFKPTGNVAGIQPIHETSTTQKHRLGTRVIGYDATYGEVEFVYAKGVASTAAGDLILIDTWAGSTTRADGSDTPVGTIGVAMSANVASQYGWYAVRGSVMCNADTSAAVGAAYLHATAGLVDSTLLVHCRVLGCTIVLKEGTSDGAGTGKAIVELNYPWVGNVSISTI